MLRSLRLHPYKLHTDINLEDLPSLSLLVGRNNSGKSAVLQAAALPKYGLRWDPILPTVPWESGTTGGNLNARVELGLLSGSVVLQFSSIPENHIQWEVTQPNGSKRSGQAFVPPPPQLIGPVLFGPQLPGALGVYYMSAFRAVPDRTFSYLMFNRDLGPDGGGCWNVIHQLKADNNPKFNDIQEVVAELGLGIQTMRTPTAALGSGSIRMENYGRTDTLPFVGSGTGSALPVITQGTLCEPGETFLVEEPELHLHKSAMDGLGAFFGKMAQRGVQVILTTHSTAFFASLFRGMDDGRVPKDVAVFIFDRKTSGETSFRRVPLTAYHAAVNAAEKALSGFP